MKTQTVGTVTTLDEQQTRTKRRSSGFGGGTGGGGNGKRGGGGGGGGGDKRDNDNNQERNQFTPSKYRVAMYIILTMIVMTFAGLISAYVVIAVNKEQEWKPFDLPIQVFVSTLIIIASGITYELARSAINAERQEAYRKWLIVTTFLGGAFVSSQLLSWFALVQQGVYVQSNPYAGFFYILTAAHALHLVGGIGALGYLVLRAWKTTPFEENIFKRQTATSVVGLYWHTMDGLWLVLLGLLVFWK